MYSAPKTRVVKYDYKGPLNLAVFVDKSQDLYI